MVQTIITEHELEWIHNVIRDWLHADEYYCLRDQEFRDEVIKLQNSLPLLTRDMEFEDDCI
jgi:hypothetical protein